jgi:aminoglycoside phosphotransferase (APT) family kinase protein
VSDPAEVAPLAPSLPSSPPVPAPARPSGLDELAVGRWLAQRCGLTLPVTIVPALGGRSNLTSVVTDAAGRRVVVRRPPLTGVLASAHDMVREHRVLAALGDTDVPVPKVLGVEPDAAVTGAPFFVMAHVDGLILRGQADATALEPARRHAIGLDAIAVLARLHAVDIDAVGLGDLARRDGYLARQLARWRGQLAAGGTRPLPMLAELAARLAAELPAQQRLALVHGDFRLDNLVVDSGTARVVGVLDWELATLGDPLADLGLLLVYWGGREVGEVLPDAPTQLIGFPAPEELVAAYALSTGEDPDLLAERVRPYMAFGLFKLACILEGVRIRTLGGGYGGPGAVPTAMTEVERFLDLVPALGERGLDLLGPQRLH